MPPQVEEKTHEKPGFLALGFQPGQAVPLFEQLGIPSRIGQEGEALWQVLPDLYELNRNEPYGTYIWKKWDWILNAMFRGWNLFLRALDGNPIRMNYSWNAPILPGPDLPSQVPTLFEPAPYQAQKMALTSAFEYLKPQLEA